MKSNISTFIRQQLAAAITFSFCVGPIDAATITVNSSDDDAASTSCNLRAALASIDAAAAVPACSLAVSGTFGANDTIEFSGALASSTITLTQGQLEPTKPVTIQGSAQKIDAANGSAILKSLYGNTVLNDLTLRNGAGGYYAGGVSLVGGTLTLNRVEMTGNDGAAGAVGAFGGQDATIKIYDSYLHGNTASSSGGAVFVQNGSLTLAGTMLTANVAQNVGGGVAIGGGAGSTVTDCDFIGNSAQSGGALSLASKATVKRTTVTGNSASQFGGAASFTSSTGTLALVESVLANNSAAHGGAIGTFVGGGIEITNSTLTGNTASASGGAIYAKKYPHVVLTNATISGNSAASAGAMWFGSDGNYGETTLAFSNSIVSANNAAADKDLGGTFSELTGNNNLFGTALNTAPLNDAGRANVFSDTPGLGPLQDNGGATWTRALLSGSAAIGKGSKADAAGLATDQRGTGFARVVDATVDIGAYEYLGEDRLFLGDFEPDL